MSRQSQRFNRGLFCTGLAFSLLAIAAPLAAEPAKQIIAPFDGSVPGRGASVSGGGEWAIVADGAPECDLRVYRRNWRTMGWGTGIDGTDADQTDSGSGGADAFYDIVTNNSQATCDDGNFGETSSLSGDVLVVGVPLWDSASNFCPPTTLDAGGILVYAFSGNDNDRWQRRASGNCVGSGEVIVAGDPQNLAIEDLRQPGALFGSSVSVSRAANNRYTIAVGEPEYDAVEGVDTDEGRVFIYEYLVDPVGLTNDNITLVSTFTGQPGDRLGSAVTVNAVSATEQYVLAGAPGAPGGPGKALLFQVSPGSASLARTIGGFGSAQLGREVSLSNRYLVVAGANEGFTYLNPDEDGDPAKYQPVPGAAAVSTGGGDVSQSGGVIAYGLNGSGGGATVLRDQRSDGIAQALSADVAADVGGELADIGIDIRLVDESLWFANEAGAEPVPADRAILYQYPAGFGGKNAQAFGYYLHSMPCDVSGKTVGELFGYLGTLGQDYDIYGYDTGNVTGNRPYVQLNAGSVPDPRFAVWIATAAADRYVPVGDCNGFTAPDRVDGPDPLVQDDPLNPTPFVGPVRTQKLVALPAAEDPDGVDDGDRSDDFARVMLSNPFPRAFSLADLRYITPLGDVNTLEDAEANSFLSKTVYLWEPENDAYRALAPNTPGFDDRIEAYQGFWLVLGGEGQDPQTADGHTLAIPQLD